MRRAQTLDEIKAPLKATQSFGFDVAGQVDAMCGWFDVDFKGSPEHPAYQPITLTTGPDATGATHWGQQSFYLGKQAFVVNAGDKVRLSRAPRSKRTPFTSSFRLFHRPFESSHGCARAAPGRGGEGEREDECRYVQMDGTVTVVRRKDNQRLLNVMLEADVEGSTDAHLIWTWHIE